MPLIVDKAGKEPKDTLMLTPRTDLTVTPPPLWWEGAPQLLQGQQRAPELQGGRPERS